MMFYSFGIVLGRFAPAWVSESAWQSILEIIKGSMSNSSTIGKAYLALFSAAFAVELLIIVSCFSFVAFPIILLLFFCGGVGTSITLTAYYTLFQGHGLLFGILVLGMQLAGYVTIYVLLAELFCKVSKNAFLRKKGVKKVENNEKMRYPITVKLFTLTVALAAVSLYFAVMKHYFSPQLPL